MNIIRVIGLTPTLRDFGFNTSLCEFTEFLDQQDAKHRAWLESGPKIEILDWPVEALWERGWQPKDRGSDKPMLGAGYEELRW